MPRRFLPRRRPKSSSRAYSGPLEEDNIALVKETDLDIVPQYVRTQAVGSLYVAHNEGEMQKGFEVVFGRTLTGEFILPWGGDDISDLLTNGVTHLTFAVADSSDRGEPLRLLSTVYFDEVREIYFGDRKVFIVCRGRKEE